MMVLSRDRGGYCGRVGSLCKTLGGGISQTDPRIGILGLLPGELGEGGPTDGALPLPLRRIAEISSDPHQSFFVGLFSERASERASKSAKV